VQKLREGTIMNEQNAEKNHRKLPPSMCEDLAVVSCFAAREVHEVLEGQGGEFEAVRNLVKIIKESIISSCHGSSLETMVDPSKAVAMNRALEHSELGEKDSMKTVAQLVTETEQVIDLLDGLVKDPTKVRQDKSADLKKLRALCLALSSSVIACEEPVEELELEIT
jgi:hypothetical protein